MKTTLTILIILLTILNPVIMLIIAAFWLYYKAVKYSATKLNYTTGASINNINYSAPHFTMQPKPYTTDPTHTPIPHWNTEDAETISRNQTQLTPNEEQQFRQIISKL